MDDHDPARRHLLTALATGSAGIAALASADAAAAQAAGPGSPGSPGPQPAAPAGEIDRAFVRLREGLVHYRCMRFPAARESAAARNPPLYMAHAGPGSSRAFAALMKRLAPGRALIAPDTLGFGDSAAPDVAEPDVPYYAESVVRILDALRIDRVDWYGSHTGAHIGCELAIRWPSRVRRIVFDGITIFPAEFRRELLARYAPRIEPDDAGGHLLWAWQFVRDMSLFFPHYARDAAHRLANAVPPAEALHRSVVDVLKALATYHLGYDAVFRHDIESRLPLLTQPVLCLGSESDPMSAYVDRAAQLVPGSRKVLVPRSEGVAGAVAAVERFLA